MQICLRVLCEQGRKVNLFQNGPDLFLTEKAIELNKKIPICMLFSGVGEICEADFTGRTCPSGTQCIDGVCVVNPNATPLIGQGTGKVSANIEIDLDLFVIGRRI